MAEIDDAEKINGKKYRIYPGQDNPVHEFGFWSRTFMPQGTVYEEYDTCHEVANVVANDPEKYQVENLPAKGEPVEAGKLYLYNDDIYRAEVDHLVTGNDPEDEVPKLYTVYRPNPKALGWMAGEHVEKGTERRYRANDIYVCNVAHITAKGLEPNTVWPEGSPKYWSLKPS